MMMTLPDCTPTVYDEGLRPWGWRWALRTRLRPYVLQVRPPDVEVLWRA